MGTPATGALAKLAFDVALPFDSSSIPMEFDSSSIGRKGVILSTSGIRGSRQEDVNRTRNGGYAVSGSLTMPVSPVMLDYWLPLILGGNESTDVFDLAETLPQAYLMMDYGTKVFTWSGVAVNKASFKVSQAKILMVTLDIEAETESVGNSGTFPSLTMPTDSPYVMSDSVLTLQGSAREHSELEVIIDNMLQTDRFQNSLTRTDFPSNGLMVSVNTNHPYSTSEVDLYAQSLLGAAGNVVFTNADVANKVLTMAFGALQVPANAPEIPGKSEIRLPLQMIARKSGSAPAVRFTNAQA